MGFSEIINTILNWTKLSGGVGYCMLHFTVLHNRKTLAQDCWYWLVVGKTSHSCSHPNIMSLVQQPQLGCCQQSVKIYFHRQQQYFFTHAFPWDFAVTATIIPSDLPHLQGNQQWKKPVSWVAGKRQHSLLIWTGMVIKTLALRVDVLWPCQLTTFILFQCADQLLTYVLRCCVQLGVFIWSTSCRNQIISDLRNSKTTYLASAPPTYRSLLKLTTNSAKWFRNVTLIVSRENEKDRLRSFSAAGCACWKFASGDGQRARE